MIIVSACLLGFNCRYDGRTRSDDSLLLSPRNHICVPVCPEQLGGLPTPRSPSEIHGGDGSDVLTGKARVITAAGTDVTDNFLRGAEDVLRFMKLWGISIAVMTERSPSCGVDHIKRNGVSVPGSGVTSALIQKNGFDVISSDRIGEILPFITGKVRE